MGLQRRMMMNKKGVQIKNALFAIIAVSMAIIAIGAWGQSWSDHYGSGITYDLQEYEDLQGISSEAQEQKQKVTPTDPDPSTGDFEGKIFRGGYGILGSIFTPFQAVFNMLESLESRYGLPGYIAEGILSFMFIALISAIISVIFRLGRSP